MGIHRQDHSASPRQEQPHSAPGQGTLLAAGLEHPSAWTFHSVQQLQQQLLQNWRKFLLHLCLQGLVPGNSCNSDGEFGCLHVFFFFEKNPPPLRYLMSAIEKRIIMSLKTKSLSKVFREPSGGFLQRNSLRALRAAFSPSLLYIRIRLLITLFK